jgi:YesN/AraC family two-component response regulator
MMTNRSVRIALFLENWEQEGIEIIGEASNGVEALEFLAVIQKRISSC